MTENCSKCHRSSTYQKQSKTRLRVYWYRDQDGKRLCRWCYLKHIANPKKIKCSMKFKGFTIVFPFRVRIGVCFIVGCTRTSTDRHHIEYLRIFPLAQTVELCDQHHREENALQEQQQDHYFFDWNRTIVPLPSQ